ncbi:hypothetical protein GPALN_003007 [Globodera pallida]|nr:hypothetical protein GPALN_003007 [Globodera pallida]
MDRTNVLKTTKGRADLNPRGASAHPTHHGYQVREKPFLPPKLHSNLFKQFRDRVLFHAAAHKKKRVPSRRGAKPFLALWLGTARLMASRRACLMAHLLMLVELCIPLSEHAPLLWM